MDYARRILCVFCVIIFSYKEPLLAGPACDGTRSEGLPEGNIGETAHFPWLGLLRVHLHHGDSMKIALTGLVMVKERYAIANSDDVSRIPKQLFRQDSKAMFIPKDGEPWFCPVKDYTMHPEYEFSTYNTIALVELLLDANEKAPLRPICWPQYFYNTSNQLYALGYTDENKLLEKMVYKLQYVKLSLCNEFYHRAGLSEMKSAPTHIQCGFAPNNKKDCQWENGMALASNSSGRWTLIGVSLRGPGCAAPARFVDMFPYLPWVESATDLEEIDELDYRRNGRRQLTTETRHLTSPQHREHREEMPAPGVGPYLGKNPPTGSPYDGRPVPSPAYRAQYHLPPPWPYIRTTSTTTTMRYSHEEIPLHDPRFTFSYGIDVDALVPYVIDRVDKDAIEIHTFDKMYERKNSSCSSHKNLIYREKLRLVEKTMIFGKASYRISLYNMMMSGYDCVKIKIHAFRRGLAKLWYRFVMEQEDWFPHSGGPETPQEMLKYYRLFRRLPAEQTADSEKWVPGDHLDPKHITDTNDYTGIQNLNILVWFLFRTEATMELEVYGLRVPEWFPPPTSSTTTRPTKRRPTPPPYMARSDQENVYREQERAQNTLFNNESRRYDQRNNRKQGVKIKIIRRKYSPKSRSNSSNNRKSDLKRAHRRRRPKRPRHQMLERTDKKSREVHHSVGYLPKNPYRLQKAILRESERLSVGSLE